MDGKDNNRDEKQREQNEKKAGGLTQLEQDILAKSHGRGGSGPAPRPGVESMNNSSNSRPSAGLTQLEQDIAAKQSVRGSGMSSKPAAAPSASASSLSQLEQDISAKTQSRGGTAASRPGAMSTGGGNHLTQLERDIAAKSQGNSAVGGAATLSQLERDAATKQSARQGMATSSKNLTQLEEDINAKMQARGGGAASSTPGAVSSGGMGNLTTLERGILAKTQSHMGSKGAASHPGAMSSVGMNSLNLLEDNIRNKTNSMTTQASVTNNGLHQLESDILDKQNAVGSGGVAMRPTAGTAMPSQLNNLESEIARKMQGQDTQSIEPRRYDAYQNEPPSTTAKAPPVNTGDTYNSQIAPETTVYNNAGNNCNPYDDNGYNDVPTPPLHRPQSNPSYAPGVRPDEIPMDDPEAPLYPTHGSSDDGAEIGGIEAFVADNVVDATEVAVIMSDEEEEVELKKRQRKLVIRMALGVVVVLISVIVPIALLTRGGEVEITPSPTLAPTEFPTLSPTSTELSDLVDSLAIKGISSLADLQNRQSAQGLAVDWIVNDDTYVDLYGLTDLDDEFIQRYVLAVFYFALGGDKWAACSRTDDSCSSTGKVNGWLTNTSECSWFVVACDEDGIVNSIEFQDSTQDENFKGRLTPLEGNMPSEIGILTALEHLVISGMTVSGPILSYLNKTSNLTVIDVHDNKFTGSIPYTFGEQHPALVYVNLEDNQITGEIPTSFGGFTSLTTLNVQSNKIRGTIPSELAAIPTLNFLDIGDNELTGKIPLELYDQQFVTLRMTNNLLEGSISTLIGTMMNLTDFTIGSSLMTGEIPSEMYKLTNLKILDLHNSSFTGPLPEIGFGNLTELRRFEVHMNEFTGTIPSAAILAMTNLERIQLQDNDQLLGSISKEICGMRGGTPLSIQVMIVGCNIECDKGCCDENAKCEEDLYF